MDLASSRAVDAGTRERTRIRSRDLSGPTAGLAPGNVQANLVILPQALALDFLRFAQANPKPCPVLAVSEPGDQRLPSLGEDLDIRTDLPAYRVLSCATKCANAFCAQITAPLRLTSMMRR